jgi:hypothetical protein
MPETVPQQDVAAALKRLEKKDPGLKRLLNKAHGYAVFPSVGKAAAVVGGAFGRGKVFERGKFIGHATVSQLTLGVQLGGDTFTEVIVFESKQALDRFKQGKTAFAASASAVLVKAGAAAANNFNRRVAVYAYSDGGMLLELSIGGQRFKFKPAGQQEQGQEQGQGQKQGQAAGKGGKSQRQGGGQAEAEDSGEEDEQGEGEEGEQDDQGQGEGDEDDSSLGLVRRAFGGVRGAASSVGTMAKEHPLAASLVGAGLAAGLVFMISRAVRRAGDSSGEDEESQGEEGSDEYEGAEDQSDSGEEEDESQRRENGRGDEGEGEEEDRFLRRGRARA